MEHMTKGIEPKQKSSYFESRLRNLRQSADRLDDAHQRLETLEQKLTGEKIRNQKGEKTSDSNDNLTSEKSSIMTELNDIQERYDYLISIINDTIIHLEDIV